VVNADNTSTAQMQIYFPGFSGIMSLPQKVQINDEQRKNHLSMNCSPREFAGH
jgi:hypothetical protein